MTVEFRKHVVRALVLYIVEIDEVGMRLYYSDGTTELFSLASGVSHQLASMGVIPPDHTDWLKKFKGEA